MGTVMSFSVTPAELARVEAFKMAQLTLEPRQAADVVMVIIITAIYFIQLLAVLFMLWNRKYPPIKAKSPWVMLGIFLASIFWFVGDLQVNGHAPLKGSPFTNCKFFSVWMHIIVGVCPVGSLIALRSYGLYQVFCLNRPYLGMPLYGSVGMLVGILLTFGIVTQSISATSSVYYVDGFDICGFNKGYQIAIFVMVWVLWTVVAALNWRIRNIKSSFKESRESMIMCIIAFGILTFMTALSYSMTSFPFNVKARIVATSVNQFSAMATWWLPMAIPLYNCLFRREKYLKQWVYKLRQDGLQRAYHVEPKSEEEHIAPALNHSYLHDQSPHVNKEIANVNGEFFYGDSDSEKASMQMRTAVESNTLAAGLIHRSQSPPVTRRPPWDNASNGISAKPYMPIINLPGPATSTPPQRTTATPRLHQEAKHSSDGRQLL
ncbi:hypothetical protein GGI20_004877 [Coemansia sp. BCRC 34301]|nr:hypothetical protein GGI20_004877 [Coemansia sp. BCRC 34301]